MRNKLGLIAAILATTVGLSAVDLFLARTETIEVSDAARRNFEKGSRLLAEGRAGDAVEALQKAYATDRNDSSYALELAAALMQAGKRDEAQNLLSGLLERTPNDGAANLLEARLLLLKGEYPEADPYYHRAIYGTWTEHENRQRVNARLELAGLLASHGSSEELLAELLPLEAEAGGDLAVRKQLAHLYLVAKSPARAQSVYRALISEDPDDPANYSGLGQAELQLGNYRAALPAFQKAGAKEQTALAEELVELDPSARYLGAAGKLSRAVDILQRVRDAAAHCSPELVKGADEMLSKKIRGPATDELAEERVAVAEQLWQARLNKCGASVSAGEAPLRLLMAKLARR